MAWTYTPADLATSQLMQVRYLVGDTVATDQQVLDEEITFALSQRGSVYGAAATVCRSIAAKFSRRTDTIDKDLRTLMSSQAKAYSARANEFENQAAARSGAAPYAGGISIADKVQQELNPDRVPPNFNIGMTDDYFPVAPVGNEGTPLPADQDDDTSDNV